MYCGLDIPAQMSTRYLELIKSGEIISLNLADFRRLPNFGRGQPNPSSYSRSKTSSVIYCPLSLTLNLFSKQILLSAFKISVE